MTAWDKDNDFRDVLVETFMELFTARTEKGKLILSRTNPDIKYIETRCEDIRQVVSEYMSGMVQEHKKAMQLAAETTTRAIEGRDALIRQSLRETLQEKQVRRVIKDINYKVLSKGTTKQVF